MSKQIIDTVLNSNSLNFLHTNYRQKQVHQIQPDKFTFLKSNLLISNILNRNISKQKKNQTQKVQCKNQQNDAYINCQVQMSKLKDQREVQKARNSRVKNLTKCRSQKTFQQFKSEEKHVKDLINNVYLMKKQMTQKAAEIMGKKQDNSYMGRNLFTDKRSFLKQMRENNPTQKSAKVQTTRLFMKQSAKKYNQQQYKQMIQQSQSNQSLFSTGSQNTSNINTSFQASLLDISYTNKQQSKKHHDQVLKKLITNKSQSNFLQEQRRKAVWEGFSTHWRKGCEKGQEQNIKELKKKNHKKNLKPKFQTSEHSILNYNDQFTRQVALKKYQHAFMETAETFQLKVSC